MENRNQRGKAAANAVRPRHRKKKKKSAMAVFLRGFFKSVLTIGAVAVVGFTSYKLTWMYYDANGGPKSNETAKKISELYGGVEAEEISKNLIYGVDGEQQIKAIVLEVFNTHTNNMDYITIPLRSQFTISNELYQKLCASGCDAPQIIKLSKIDEYFEDATLYQYGVILLEDLLDVDINYYTAVPMEQFEQMFKKGKASQAVYNEDGNSVSSYVEYQLKDSYLQEISSLSEEELKDYVKEKQELCQSNLSTSKKLNYLDAYRRILPEYIHVHSLYGILTDKIYTLDVEKCNELLHSVIANDTAYTEEQSQGSVQENTASSAGYNIEILNGSKINGLAASYQDRLVQAGYTVQDIGNYSGDLVASTRIIVRSQEMGKDLQTYFPNTSIEIGELPEGIDIQIILGTDASEG